MRQFEARILSNRAVADSWRELSLDWSGGEAPSPGQFFTIRVSRLRDPLLRRPLAFSGFKPATVTGASGAAASAIYQIRGPATRLLADLAVGSTLDLIGPLGKPFPSPAAGQSSILAGGGIGIGPLLFLADALAAGGAPPLPGAVVAPNAAVVAPNAAAVAPNAAAVAPNAAVVTSNATAVAPNAASAAPLLVLGFRNAAALPAIQLPPGTIICTDDGSAGFRGTPVDWIARNAPAEAPRLCGCGPAPMLAALAALTAERGWPAWLSAEQWMACGVGACMGCALPKAGGGYLRACVDGPVFEAGAIAWAACR